MVVECWLSRPTCRSQHSACKYIVIFRISTSSSTMHCDEGPTLWDSRDIDTRCYECIWRKGKRGKQKLFKCHYYSLISYYSILLGELIHQACTKLSISCDYASVSTCMSIKCIIPIYAPLSVTIKWVSIYYTSSDLRARFVGVMVASSCRAFIGCLSIAAG